MHPLLSRLPTEIFGNLTELCVTDAAVWPAIQNLTADQREIELNFLSFPPSDEDVFTRHERYMSHVSYLQGVEEHVHVRQYLILDKQTNRMVGNISVRAFNEARLLAVGYEIFPDCRRRGFASDAVNAVCNKAADSGALYVCAETLDKDGVSSGLLLKNGFREYATGLCTTSRDYKNEIVRRFLKPNERAPEFWPLNPTSPILGSGT